VTCHRDVVGGAHIKESNMNRRAFDTLISVAGLLLAGLLLVAGGLLTWAHSFVSNEVHDQLAAQQIYFPPAGSDAIAGPEFKALQQYAGQQLTTGDQAEAYADHFIAVHLKEIGGGKTYAQLSSESLANPDDTALAGQVATLFKGETLRGLLLNAYAFGKMGAIAGIGAIVAFIAAALMLALALLGLWHARRVPANREIFMKHEGSETAEARV
jgi:hypothetical protein